MEKFGLNVIAVGALILLGSACSNPLSSGQENHIQNFHSKNVNCDELNFNDGTINVDEIRSLTHCLNAQGELNEFDVLLNAVADSDLQPLTELVNDVVSKQPKFLFALRESYSHAKQTGDLKILEQTVSKLWANSARNEATLKVLQKVATPLINTVFDDQLDMNLSNLYVISKSRALQRLGAEYLETDGFNKILNATAHYLNAPDAKPLRTLYAFITANNLNTRWSNVTAQSEQARVQNLAHFFEWLFTDGRYQLLSKGIQQVMATPVKCFAGSKSIPNPLAEMASQLSNMTSTEATQYFTHDIKNLYLASQGFCEFPYSLNPLIKLVGDATKVAGYSEVYDVIHPLLSNPDFLTFLGSDASSRFVTDVSFLVQRHFFEDFFTLVTLHLRNPITNDGAKIAALLEDLIKPLSDTEVQTVADYLSPLLHANEGYGLRAVKSLYQMSFGFPDISVQITPTLKSKLVASVRNIISKPQLAPVMDLGEKLIVGLKFDGIIDQTLTYLSNLFETGRFHYILARTLEPANASMASALYLLEKITDAVPVASECSTLTYDWNFNNFSTSSSAAYLQQMDAIQNCINPNQTFLSAKDLVNYSISKAYYHVLLQTEKTVINGLFKINQDQFLGTLDDFLAVNQTDSDTIRKLLNLSSLSLNLVKSNFLAKSQLRNMVSDFIKNPITFQTVAELTGPKPERLRSSEPTLDLVNLTHINAIVTKDQKLSNATVEDAVKAIMLQYCPSLDTTKPDCNIDADQVQLYEQSPKLLYQQAAQEELDSSQSWLHPKLSQGWVHQTSAPTMVSALEFHLNPMLHLLRKAPSAPQGILNAMARIKHDHRKLDTFLTERATRVLLIPYIYQLPNYPISSSREYSNRIRIRVVNDIDRLELIAINADFKAFNVVSNIGMGFIRDIGLAWGDVPPADRPASLARLIGHSEIRTLKAEKEYIESQMATFDRSILQSLGNCDQRGRTLIGRLIVASTCNNEISDVSARMFNLRFLISLLADELPESDGGYGGLVVLRDIFYGLYEGNTDAQRDNFANGVDLGDACLQNPLNFAEPNSACQKDVLTMIPRITHLGLMHQAGISVLQAQDHPLNAVVSVINHVTDDTALSQQFVNAASSDAGLQFIRDAVDYGFQSPDGTAKNLSLLTQMVTIPKNLNWVNLALEIIPKAPHFPAQNKVLINSMLSIDADAMKPWVDHWLVEGTRPTPRFLNQVMTQLTPATRAEIIELLVELTPNSATFAQYFTSAKNLPDLHTKALKKDVNLWVSEFAGADLASTRSDLADWTLSPDFARFCDVFSDSTFTTKAYNFLESVNQNADAKIFLQSCRDFLNLH
jgi:hypothetical protein